MTVWVGVDPGSRWSGVVARDGMRLIGFKILDMHVTEPGADRPGAATMEAIAQAIDELADPATCRIAIEDLVQPEPHMGLTNVTAILRTAEVIGWLRCTYPDAVLIRPNGHGHHALASYLTIPGLVSKQEHRNALAKRRLLAEAPQNSTLRHARSAWDVAGTAAAEDRIAVARASTAARRAAAR